jgi:hypothetical protein
VDKKDEDRQQPKPYIAIMSFLVTADKAIYENLFFFCFPNYFLNNKPHLAMSCKCSVEPNLDELDELQEQVQFPR